MTVRDATRVVLVVLLFVTVQQTLMLDIRVGGVHPDIMVLLPIVAGIVGARHGGRRWASAPAWWPTCSCPPRSACRPWSAAWSASAWGWPPWPWTGRPGGCRRWPPWAAAPSTRWSTPLLGSVLGQPQMLHVDLVRIVVVVSVANAVLALPALRLVAWALPAASTEGVPDLGRSPRGALR